MRFPWLLLFMIVIIATVAALLLPVVPGGLSLTVGLSSIGLVGLAIGLTIVIPPRLFPLTRVEKRADRNLMNVFGIIGIARTTGITFIAGATMRRLTGICLTYVSYRVRLWRSGFRQLKFPLLRRNQHHTFDMSSA